MALVQPFLSLRSLGDVGKWVLIFASFLSQPVPAQTGSDPTVGVLPPYNDVYANWANAGLRSVGGIPHPDDDLCDGQSARWRTGRLHRHPERDQRDVRQARSFSLERAHLRFIWPICPSGFRRGSHCAGRATAAAPARRTARPPSTCLMALSPIQVESAARVRR